MVVSLPPLLETWVAERVRSGLYADPSEVVREALRRMAIAEGFTPIAASPRMPTPVPQESRVAPTLSVRESATRSLRFDEADRDLVVGAVEKHFGVRLRRSGHRKIALEDQRGRPFWLLGGYGDWHGIPTDLIESASAKDVSSGVFVLAKRLTSSIRVFHAPLAEILKNVDAFGTTKLDDQRQFDLEWSRDLPSIKQSPSVRFTLVVEIDAPEVRK